MEADISMDHNNYEDMKMALIDVTAVQKEARKELTDEAMKKAKERLKTLYQTEEKAVLALKNIRREIEAYLAEVADLTTYESAGVDVSGKQ
jgi:hypothetical protein